MINNDKIHIIDWDNAGLGIPYQDFFHFAVISDYERHPDYAEEREQFLQWQSAAFPGTGNEEVKLIEFQTYLSLLLRYYDAASSHTIRAEFEPNMLQSCKYLLEKSWQSLDDYATITGSGDMLHFFGQYCEYKFIEIQDATYNDQASVAYAHHTNHHFRMPDKHEQARQNYLKHFQNVETVIITDERAKNMPVAQLAAAGTTGVVIAGMHAYAGKIDQIPIELGTLMVSLPLLAYLCHRQERLIATPFASFMEAVKKRGTHD